MEIFLLDFVMKMILMMMCQQQRTRSLLSAGGPSSFTLFFYSLSLSLSLSVCVCVCVCVIYVCIYITTIRVPSFPLRSFPKRRASNTVWREGHHKNLKYEYMNSSRVCFSLNSSRFGVVVTFSCCFLLSLLLDGFSPRAATKHETSSKSRSLSRVLLWFF